MAALMTVYVQACMPRDGVNRMPNAKVCAHGGHSRALHPQPQPNAEHIHKCGAHTPVWMVVAALVQSSFDTTRNTAAGTHLRRDDLDSAGAYCVHNSGDEAPPASGSIARLAPKHCEGRHTTRPPPSTARGWQGLGGSKRQRREERCFRDNEWGRVNLCRTRSAAPIPSRRS